MSLVTRTQFIARVIDEITQGKSLPIQPKADRMDKIIDTAIAEWRQNSDDANEVEYIIFRQDVFETPLFKAKRQVQLPDCVLSISYLKTLGANFYNQTVNKDFQKTNFAYATAISGNSYDMLTSVVNGYYVDFLRNFVLKDVTYNFSPYTHMLTVIGRDPAYDLVSEAHVYIPEGALFNIPDFFHWVCAKCIINFANIYGFVNAKQIGSYDLNITELKGDAKETIERVRQTWEDQKNTSDFFYDV